MAIGLWLPVGNINLSCRVSLSFQAARVGLHHEKKGPSAESQYYVYARKLYKWLCMEIMSRTEFNAFQYLFPSGYNIFRSIKAAGKLLSGIYTYITVHWFELIGQVKNHLDSGPTHVRCYPLTRKRKETSWRPSPPSFIIPMKSSWRLSQPLINNHGGNFALCFPTFLNYSCGYHLRLNSSCIRRHGQRKQFCWLKLRYPFQFCENVTRLADILEFLISQILIFY